METTNKPFASDEEQVEDTNNSYLADSTEENPAGNTLDRILQYISSNTRKIFVGYLIIMAIFVFLFETVFELSRIPSESMGPTLMTGTLLVSSRTDIHLEDIHRYDIIIFFLPEEDDIYIKRVIGLPGETIEVRNGSVYADGVELDKSFTNGSQDCRGDGTWSVPADCFFMLGDNRDFSNDSRYWDNPYVHISAVEAKAKLILFPFSRFGSLDYEEP